MRILPWLAVGFAFLASFAPEAHAAADLTLKQLKAELRKHPDAQWTPVKSEMEAMVIRHGRSLGLSRMHHSPKDSVAEFIPADAWQGLPSAFDWRNAYGHDWTTPVKDQGQCGSCVAFAGVGTLEISRKIAGGNPTMNELFSEQDLFSRIGFCNWGAEPDAAMDEMLTAGVADEACFPYEARDVDSSSACDDRASRVVKINRWEKVTTANLKAALQNGPVLTTMEVYSDFEMYQSGVYRHVAGADLGGHAVVIVGYDDKKAAWIVRNSWGASWGEKGYFEIAYGDASGLAGDNWQLDVTRKGAAF